MKKLYLILGLVFGLQTLATAQLGCGDSFTDSGGAAGSYQNNEDDTITICPTLATDVVSLNFSAFDLENNYDFMYIFDGNSVAGNLIGTYTGTNSPGIVNAENTSGCLTIVFTSDGSVTNPGWDATVSCVPEPSCLRPTSVLLDSNTDLTGTISWTNGGTETQWLVEYGANGFAIGTGTSVVTSSNPFTITGLTELTNYDVYVRAFCSVGDTSNYSTVVSFTTDMSPLPPFICGNLFTDAGGVNGNYSNSMNDTIVICPTLPTDVIQLVFSDFQIENNYDFMTIYDNNIASGPSFGVYTDANSPGTIVAENISGCLTVVFTSDNSVIQSGWVASINCVAPVSCLRPNYVIINSMTDISADISWTNMGSATQWVVEYDTAGFVLGTGTQVVTSNNPFTINGLNPTTSYDFYVRSFCGVGDTSLFSNVLNFQTNGTPLFCGDVFTDSGDDTGNFTLGENYNVTICPTLANETVELVFSAFDLGFGQNIMTIYDNNLASGTIIGTYQGTNMPQNVVAENATGCLTVNFASNSFGTAAGWIASVNCIPEITCFKPTGLTVDATTDVTATVSWTIGGTETQWVVEYGVAGFAQGSGTSVVSTTNPYTITGLTELTDYDVYVRAYCGGIDTSFYSSVISFTTDMSPLPPFICGNLFTDNGGVSANYSANSNDTIVICPTNGGDVVVLTFTEFNTENGYDSLTVYNGNSVASPLLGIYQGATSPGIIYSTDLTGCLTAVFVSDNIVQNPGWSASISCQAPITCLTPSNLTVDSNTDLTGTVSWTNVGTETQWVVEYGVAGFAAGTGTSVMASTNPFTITGLTELTDYDVYVRAFCGGTDTSFYSSVISFTTDMTPLAPFICGNLFTDAGGLNLNYSDNTNDTIVICPTNSGDVVYLTFTDFFTENGFDSLTIYDGNSVLDPMIGIYQGELLDSIGTLISTNSNGCLTAVFMSDGSATEYGWVASISCNPSCVSPSNLVATSITSSSASLGWANGANETAWIVEYGVTGFTPGTGTMLAASSNPITVGGLTTNTSYQYYVTAICSVNDSSSFSPVGTFTTLNNAGISENEIYALSIVPNPSTGKFVIKNASALKIEGQLFDAQGRALDLKVNTIDANKEVVLDLTNFVDGVYFFKTTSSIGTKTYSLVKN